MIFFFQAEDGIRDYKVTGVQTCALPISWITAPGIYPESAENDRYRAESLAFLGGLFERGLDHAVAVGTSAEYRPSRVDRKSTRLNSSHLVISYAVFCLKKKNTSKSKCGM